MMSNKWKAVDNISIKFRGLKSFYNVKDTLTGAWYDISSFALATTGFLRVMEGRFSRK